ncbi:MAG: isoleucine--tRNA ligase, partial [Clostridiales bacterium]|nr:isoleucine--tRNA ligase [Clostridiales bacterium]
ESIHLCDFPIVDEDWIDKKLEEDMKEVLQIVVLGRAARNGSNIKNRQPLAVMYVSASQVLDKFYTEIIEDELNIKSVEFINDVSGLVDYKFKPQLKTLGPKYGKQLGEIRTALLELDGSKAKSELDKNGEIKINISIGEISLATEDLLIESQQKTGFFTVSEGEVTVSLDTTLSNKLIEEGFVREVISKIQTMRKDSGFDVMDNINVYIGGSGSEKVSQFVQNNADEIKHDVLANEIIFDVSDVTDNVKEWDINGEKVIIAVEKV